MTAVGVQPEHYSREPPAPGTAALPQGLKYLASLDQIIVKQKQDFRPLLAGFLTINRYEIMNNKNQQIFYVQEESADTCQRVCCMNRRGFDLHIADNSRQEVMRIHREFANCKGCCWCADGSCGFLVTVEAPIGRPLGYVRQQYSKCGAHFAVYDTADRHMFTTWGSGCSCQNVCCNDEVHFPITDPSEKTTIGNITKQWLGCFTRTCLQDDQYSLTFPQDMNVDTKCLLIGALFLVDYVVFEAQRNKNDFVR